jgi:mannitol-specific phosphotransferase system IIBC component
MAGRIPRSVFSVVARPRKLQKQEIPMKSIFALVLMAVVAITSPAVLADHHSKGKDKSEMKGDNASDMGKMKREEGKARAEKNKEEAKMKKEKAKGKDDKGEEDDED